jgi:hypothetical protein
MMYQKRILKTTLRSNLLAKVDVDSNVIHAHIKDLSADIEAGKIRV